MTYDKALRLFGDKPKLPPDLSKPHQDLEDDLSTLRQDSIRSDQKISRYSKAMATRRQNIVLGKIKVEPLTSKPKQEEQTKSWHCKKNSSNPYDQTQRTRKIC